jgi:subfamily B ATP-binding cassette protein MsbA
VRFYDPIKGAVTVDGEDIRKFTTASLRSRLGIVTQDVILFNETITRNIAYGVATPDRKRLRQAAEAANATEFIEALPNGFDTVIGPRGMTLSGGQRQRLAVARAIYKDPPVLIFDEATSALDSESETAVQRAINNLLADRTALIVAHRLSTVRNADLIAVIDKGRIVDSGTHETLMAGGGLYRRLYELQFADTLTVSGDRDDAARPIL